MATKQEQKMIQEKISKVREVVKNASTNDIILALYNFDMNVEQTIQAFVEGGFDLALGDWEKTGGSSKKVNKKKKNTKTGEKNLPRAPQDNRSISSSHSSLNNMTSVANNSQKKNSKKLDSDSFNEKQQSHTISNSLKHESNDVSVKHDSLSQIAFADKVHSNAVESKCKSSSEKFAKCFEEIRSVLASRERFIASQLINSDTMFVYDNSRIISLIKELGQADPPHGRKELQNCPNSPSSQVSSAGETDSGIGQVSPVHEASKAVAQVKENGIGIESDAFSVDELAEIQRTIIGQLKAKGIDPSVLADITLGAGRRRQIKSGAENDEGRLSFNNKTNRRNQMNKKKGKEALPNISILE